MPDGTTLTDVASAVTGEISGHIIYDRKYAKGVIVDDMPRDLWQACWGYLWVQTNGVPTFPQAELTHTDAAGALLFARQAKYDANLLTPAERKAHERTVAGRRYRVAA